VVSDERIVTDSEGFVAYVPKSDKNIRELALGLMSGSVFCDRMLDSPRDMSMVFMPLAFMDKPAIDGLIKLLEPKEEGGPHGMIYEWMGKAGPRSINGMPIFTSLQTLSADDVARVDAMIDKINLATGMKEILERAEAQDEALDRELAEEEE